MDIGKIVIRNQEQQIPGVTCQELPPCPDLSDFSDDGVDIGELGGRTPKNLIPGVTCKVIQVMPVPFLIPVQEEPEVTTTQKPKTNENSEISVTNDTQIPIRGNPQISIIENQSNSSIILSFEMEKVAEIQRAMEGEVSEIKRIESGK